MNIAVESWWMKPWSRKLWKFNFPVDKTQINLFFLMKQSIKVGPIPRLAFIFCLLFALPAKAYLQFDQNCIQAYQKTWNLQLGPAYGYLQAERKLYPGNALPALMDNYIAFLKVFTNEDIDNYDTFKHACSKNIDILSKESGSRSPLYLFSIALIHFQSALIRARFQDFWSASFELKRAHSEFEENASKYPDFLLNYTYLQIIETMLGNLPGNVKFFLSPLGLKGNVKEGLEKLEINLVQIKGGNFSFYYPEVALFYSFLCFSLAPERKTIQELKFITDPIPDKSLMKTYVMALMAIKKYQNDLAIHCLLMKPKDPEYVQFHLLDYFLGMAYLNKLDTGCIRYFNNYIQYNKGNNFKKDAYLRISWAYTLMGKEDMAMKYLHHSLNTKLPNMTDRDKQAQREAERGIQNRYLLKSRLLFDGGYFEEAAKILNGVDSLGFSSFREKLEYTYRKGRIYELELKFPQALFYYKRTLDLGMNEPFYFAANASLHMGLIFEKMKKTSLAKQYFEQCLKMNEKEYKSSIDQEAQTGINRLN